MQVTSKDPFPSFHGLQTLCEAPFSSLHGLQALCEGSFSSLHGLQTVCEGSFSPFHGLQTVCEGSFSSLHGLQTVCEDPFPPFHAVQTLCEGSFSLFHAVQTLSRGVRFLLAALARLLQEVFLPIHQRYLPLETSFFLLFFTPTIAIPYPLSRENHPKIQKKPPFCSSLAILTAKIPPFPQLEHKEGWQPRRCPKGKNKKAALKKGEVYTSSRWAIWFYAGGLERSTSSDDQNDCTISSASFSSSLLISIRKSFSLPATQRETR